MLRRGERLNAILPGQYFDKETGLHYNYFRDYDPSTGRYVQSDPLGLKGGQFSTYGYVGSNPLTVSDPRGLALPAVVAACLADPPCAAAVVAGTYATAQAISQGVKNAWSGVKSVWEDFDTPPTPSAADDKPSAKSGTGEFCPIKNNKNECEDLLRIDTDTCNAITRLRGAAAGAICHASAGQRYGECRRFGLPGVKTPLSTWNN